MKALNLTTIALFVALPAISDTFNIGGKMIDIPAPSGYTRVTDEMPELKRLLDQMVDPLNDTLAFYIHEQSAPIALSGDIPDLDRYFILKLNKKLRYHNVSVADFEQLRTTVKLQNQTIMDEVRRQLPSLMDQFNQNLSKEYDATVAFSISQMIPLDPHLDSEDAISYSMFINYSIDGGLQESVVIPATVTMANPSGRVILLYAFGSTDDLDWTRSGSDIWHKHILARNVAAPRMRSRNIDWTQVGVKAICGAIIGVFIALIMAIRKKRMGMG